MVTVALEWRFVKRQVGVAMAAAKFVEPESGYARLDQQIAWYDSKSGTAQTWHKRMRVTQVILSAIIPLAAFWTVPAVPAALGAGILVIEAVQHLNQWQHNWITYRSTCEALRHEKYTYLEAAGPYDDPDDKARRRLLVERVESLISTEHSKWVGMFSEEKTRTKKG